MATVSLVPSIADMTQIDVADENPYAGLEVLVDDVTWNWNFSKDDMAVQRAVYLYAAARDAKFGTCGNKN